MPLNNNSLCSLEDLLIYLRKYTSTALTNKSLTDSGDHKTFTFPNTFIIEGTASISEGSTDVMNDISTIDYQAGTATFKASHGALTSNYTHLKFDYSDRYNLERLINTASNDIEEYLDRKLKLATYTSEEYAGNNRQKLLLRQWPINEVAQILYNGSALDTSSYEVTQEDARQGIIYKEDGWTAESYLIGYVGEPMAPKRVYSITYTAGYSVVPSDIQDVAIQMIAEQIQVQKLGAQGLKQITQGELTYGFTPHETNNAYGTTPGINAKYTARLNRYKRLVV